MPECIHRPDGVIRQHIGFVINPTRHFNHGRPTWVLYGRYAEIVPITFCPVCGEKLEVPGGK